jgi:hypothetical protein
MWTNPTDQPICVNADKSKVVPCDGVDAAFQLVGPGGQIPDEVAAQYAPDLPKAGARKGADAPPEDKAIDAPPEDKGSGEPRGEGPAVPRRR